MNVKKLLLSILSISVLYMHNLNSNISESAGAQIIFQLKQYLPDGVNASTRIGTQKVYTNRQPVPGSGQPISTFIANANNYNLIDALIDRYAMFDKGMAQKLRLRLQDLRAGLPAPVRAPAAIVPVAIVPVAPIAPSISAPYAPGIVIPRGSVITPSVPQVPNAPDRQLPAPSAPVPRTPETEEPTPSATLIKPAIEDLTPRGVDEEIHEIPELPTPAHSGKNYGIILPPKPIIATIPGQQLPPIKPNDSSTSKEESGKEKKLKDNKEISAPFAPAATSGGSAVTTSGGAGQEKVLKDNKEQHEDKETLQELKSELKLINTTKNPTTFNTDEITKLMIDAENLANFLYLNIGGQAAREKNPISDRILDLWSEPLNNLHQNLSILNTKPAASTEYKQAVITLYKIIIDLKTFVDDRLKAIS